VQRMELVAGRVRRVGEREEKVTGDWVRRGNRRRGNISTTVSKGSMDGLA
jgi:hypothetical protein